MQMKILEGVYELIYMHVSQNIFIAQINEWNALDLLCKKK